MSQIDDVAFYALCLFCEMCCLCLQSKDSFMLGQTEYLELQNMHSYFIFFCQAII